MALVYHPRGATGGAKYMYAKKPNFKKSFLLPHIGGKNLMHGYNVHKALYQSPVSGVQALWWGQFSYIVKMY